MEYMATLQSFSHPFLPNFSFVASVVRVCVAGPMASLLGFTIGFMTVSEEAIMRMMKRRQMKREKKRRMRAEKRSRELRYYHSLRSWIYHRRRGNQ